MRKKKGSNRDRDSEGEDEGMLGSGVAGDEGQMSLELCPVYRVWVS